MFGAYHQEFLKKKIKLILNVFGHKYFVGKKILDVGAGNGDLSSTFFRLGGNVTALDARKENLQFINKRYPNLKLLKQDLDFKPNFIENYDITFHIGTLCHIVKWEDNLRSACLNSFDLVLETAVADVDSEFECETFEDSKIFDRSYSGKGSRPSHIKIEKVISESGMFSCRLDLQELNYKNNVYDWKVENSGKKEIFLRRFWFCSKNKETIEKICKKFKTNLISPAAKKEDLSKKITIYKEDVSAKVEKIELVEKKLENFENNKPTVKEISLPLDSKIELPVFESKVDSKIEEVFETNPENKNISIIIPAFNSSKFIDECVNSIKNQKIDGDIEILIGIDSCEPTLEHIKSNPNIYKDCNVFWFEKNVGPYVVKNSLIDVAKYENILFFDSDDIMIDDALQKIYENIEDCIITFKYSNFNNREGLSSAKEHKRFAEGVFFIKKSTFNKINGFEPWKCAADTEFHERAKNNKIKYKDLNLLLFYRRIHNESLTVSLITGYRSSLRNKFIKIISEKRESSNWKLNKKTVENFQKIDNKINFNNKNNFEFTNHINLKFKIHHYIPWSTEKNLGKCYNEFMQMLCEDDWACFLDGDAIHTTTYFGKYIEETIASNKNYDLFTCYTNRVGNKYQIAPSSNWSNDSQDFHRKFGESLWKKYGTNVIDITDSPPMSGVLILINKKSWSYVGGFKEEKMLSIDNDIHLKIKNIKGKVGLMQGIYVQHWYRGGDKSNKKHLL